MPWTHAPPDPGAARALRAAEFPYLGQAAYLNSASVGPIPVRAWRAIDDINAKRKSPHRFNDTELLDVLSRARRAAARLVNARPEEIALATNTSFGLNQAALALPFREGDVIVAPSGEFPANVYPWLRLRDRGVTLELVPPTKQGWPDEPRILERVSDPRVRAVAVSLVQFSNGYRVDLDALSDVCRAHDTWLIVDAIQGLGSVPLDLATTRVDFLSCGAQKWLLSPWGSGFLYVRKDLAVQLVPATAGWMAFAGTDDFTRLTDFDDTWHPDARRFEVVTLPFQDIAGMTESLALLAEIGPARVLDHVRRLRAPLVEAAERGVFEIASPLDAVHDSAIISLRPLDPAAAHDRLEAAGVTCALREGVVRLSPHCFNTEDDIGRVVDALEQAS